MSEKQGWIKLHRRLLDSAVFQNPDLLKMWVWCMLKASHKDRKMMIGLTETTLKKGEFITGRNAGSSELNMNPSSFYRYLKALQKVQLVELKPNNKNTIVSICKWDVYQGSDSEERTTDEQQMNNKRTTDEQQMNTNKNVKNEKNEKNVVVVNHEPPPPQLKDVFTTQDYADATQGKGWPKAEVKKFCDFNAKGLMTPNEAVKAWDKNRTGAESAGIVATAGNVRSAADALQDRFEEEMNDFKKSLITFSASSTNLQPVITDTLSQFPHKFHNRIKTEFTAIYNEQLAREKKEGAE